MRPDVDINGCESGFDAFDNRLVGRWLRVRCVLKGHFRVEETFDGAEAIECGEQGVPAVGHLEGFAKLRFRDFDIRCALRPMAAQFPGSWPDCYN